MSVRRGKADVFQDRAEVRTSSLGGTADDRRTPHEAVTAGEPFLRKPPEPIDRAVATLLALALDLTVAHQAIEPRASLAIIVGADQPRDRCAG